MAFIINFIVDLFCYETMQARFVQPAAYMTAHLDTRGKIIGRIDLEETMP